MKAELIDTTASTVRNELTRMCQKMGGLTTGVVLNLIIMTDEADQYDAMRAATHAGREHPCQILGVIARTGRRPRRLDAEITVGENMPGQTVLLRIQGELNEHVDSVVTPLLVPDTPVVIWWPGKAPEAPAADALGMLGQRRITDAAADEAPRGAACCTSRPVTGRATRTWPGRAPRTGGRCWPPRWTGHTPRSLRSRSSAEADNPSADLMAAWLALRLGVPVQQEVLRRPWGDRGQLPDR